MAQDWPGAIFKQWCSFLNSKMDDLSQLYKVEAKSVLCCFEILHKAGKV